METPTPTELIKLIHVAGVAIERARNTSEVSDIFIPVRGIWREADRPSEVDQAYRWLLNVTGERLGEIEEPVTPLVTFTGA